ncbi:MAG: DUF3489 domain-containing protein [Aureliella sp.]
MPNIDNSSVDQESANTVKPEAVKSKTAKPTRTRRNAPNSGVVTTPPSSGIVAKPDSNKKAADTKSAIVLKKLYGTKGATIEQLMQATGWQAHSIRGFLSATVRKKLQLGLIRETGKDGNRRYKIADAASAD